MPVLNARLCVHRPILTPAVEWVSCTLEAGTEYTITQPAKNDPGMVHIVANGNPYQVLEQALTDATQTP